MSKIVITCEGGLVTNILSNNKEDEILVIDYDSEGADQDEIISQEEVDEFLNGDMVYDRKYKTGVSEESIEL